MASLAGLLKARGFHVTGSDQNVYPPMSDVLRELGVDARSPYRPENLPESCDLVVIGNALSRGNPELEAVLERRLAYASMPEVLKEMFLRQRRPVVIGGTHGKTTTSSLVSWVLTSAGLDPGFLIGGIPLNFGTSYAVGTGEPFVVEGDEYDTAYFDKGPKFMHYLPQVAVLGNVEFDHADIYDNVGQIERAFELFVNLIPRNGLLVVGTESALAARVARRAPCPVTSFAAVGEADWTAETLEASPRGTRLRIQRNGAVVTETTAPFWGPAAVRNLLAASAVATHSGVSGEALGRSLSSFRGVKRRMEVRGEERGVVVVDDFAHHPTAIAETLRGARLRWPAARVWGVFEPRSFTARSNVFQTELAEALSLADAVIISEVFRSDRLRTEDELSEERLVEGLTSAGREAHFIAQPDDIVSFLAGEAREGDVVLVMSNGAFGNLHQKLLDALRGS